MFPRGSRFLKINTNDKTESAILDKLLDGNNEDMIGINGVGVPANSLQITHLSFAGNIAFVIISPKGAEEVIIPSTDGE
jgi:hypothetical protein